MQYLKKIEIYFSLSSPVLDHTVQVGWLKCTWQIASIPGPLWLFQLLLSPR